jgi:hypothetical protein
MARSAINNIQLTHEDVTQHLLRQMSVLQFDLAIARAENDKLKQSIKTFESANENDIYEKCETCETFHFKIEIKNNNKPSLAISKIGISTQIRVQNVLQKVDAITWSKKDRNRKTIIDVFCKPANRIDRLRFVIRYPKLFQRDVRIYATEKEVQESLPIGSSVKIKRAPQAPLIMRASLNALQATIINLDESLSRLQQDHLIIEIENDDNIPLSIDSIQAYQLNTFITAELYPDRHYFMYCGDSMLSFPQYDLIYFQNKIPSDTKVIQAEEALLKTINVSDEFDGSQDRKLVWIGSGILCIILLLLVAQMLRKIKNATPETTPQAD